MTASGQQYALKATMRDGAQARQNMVGRWDKMFVMSGATPDYEPSPEKSIAAIAAKCNASPQEVANDYLTEKLDNFLFFPIVNYTDGDHERVREMLTDPGTLLGLSGGGANCGAIVDASVPSFMLSHWGRNRKRGPGLPLPQLLKMQTSETADFFGFKDAAGCARGCAPTSTSSPAAANDRAPRRSTVASTPLAIW